MRELGISLILHVASFHCFILSWCTWAGHIWVKNAKNKLARRASIFSLTHFVLP
jgi:hypothetical protein